MDSPEHSNHPLRTPADIYPRARYRFIYCAAGLGIGFILTGLLRGWAMLLHVWWGAFIVVIIPAAGAVMDWRRLNKESHP